MRELTPQEFALAILVSVCERKSRAKLRDRQRSSIIDDCLTLFDDPRLCPDVRRLTPARRDEIERQHRELCAETLALFETIAPLVRIMADEEFTRRPRHRA